MKKLIFCLLIIISTSLQSADNLVLVTIDGVRWQEIFGGIDKVLMNNEGFSKKLNQIKNKFWAKNRQQRAEKLAPFIADIIRKQGALIGDRQNHSKMSVANPWYFSYPGYSEIFTGIVDPSIDSNKAFYNPQVTFLEWLNNQPKYQHKLAAFGSWDLYPYIFNVKRSGLYVNSGFTPATGYKLSSETKLLNQLQKEIPSPWHNVRFDAFTYHFAKDYMLNLKPKVVTISFGETDDFAHEGKYDEYLLAINRTDQMIEELWKFIQQTEGYKDNTTLIITTDHGRGSTIDDWQHHASVEATKGYLDGLKKFPKGIVGSNNIWLAAIGPDIKSKGLIITTEEIQQKQIAATVLKLLNEPVKQFNQNVGKPIEIIFSN